MRSAVIVSTARTPIGRAYRGAFNNTPSPTLSAKQAISRALPCSAPGFRSLFPASRLTANAPRA
jgi:hypothetical protein